MIAMKEAEKLQALLDGLKAEVPRELSPEEKWQHFTGLDPRLIPLGVMITLRECEDAESAARNLMILGAAMGFGYARGLNKAEATPETKAASESAS